MSAKKRKKSTAEIRKEFRIPDNISASTSLKKHLSKVAHERNDDSGAEVLGRLELVHDVVASKPVYHERCKTNFDNVTRSHKISSKRPEKDGKEEMRSIFYSHGLMKN